MQADLESNPHCVVLRVINISTRTTDKLHAKAETPPELSSINGPTKYMFFVAAYGRYRPALSSYRACSDRNWPAETRSAQEQRSHSTHSRRSTNGAEAL